MEVIRILINLKAYREAMGERALKIAKAAEKVWKETGVLIGVAPQYLDIVKIKENTEIPVFAQHVDPVSGAFTGSNSIYTLKEYNIDGFIINHSEKRVPLDIIEKVIDIGKELKLISVVCASDPEIAEAVSVLNPDYVAVEPPELIGTGISVSKAKPEVVRSTVEIVRKVNKDVLIYVGAGITNKEDVKRALELGASGVLLASAVAKAKDPYNKILELAEGVLEALG